MAAADERSVPINIRIPDVFHGTRPVPNTVLLVNLASTIELSGTKLRTLRLLVLGGIIENQNSDFVMQ